VLPVAVDAMGGDRAPGEIVEGARRAAALGVPVTLVGRRGELGDVGDLEVVDASEVIAMGDDPASSVRRKKDSSLVRAAELVRDGKASAMVGAGNTGATMASALLRMGRIKGVSRPAIATPIPVPGGAPMVLLDAGANAECQPEWLVQFAQMGAVFARARYGIEAPRVALLSIGEEPGKGNTLVKATHELLADGGWASEGARFVGNVEGRDLMAGAADVVVTDGFTGNVVLKTLEGGLATLVDMFRAAFASTEAARRASAELVPVLDPLYESLEPEGTGGAMLLGVNGVCIISHGSSSARAVANAIEVARDMVEADVVGHLHAAIAAS
jgi:glycerol-3-phosphate acyltransferase PlsX